MDSKHCSKCIQKLLLSSFLKNATATPNSRVYATCIQCRQKDAAHRAATSKKQPTLQSLDPNIQSSKHPEICPTHPKPLDPAPLQKDATHRVAASKKRPALQSLDPNIQPSKRLKICPTHLKPLDPASLPSIQPSPLIPRPGPAIPCPAIPAFAPLEPFSILNPLDPAPLPSVPVPA